MMNAREYYQKAYEVDGLDIPVYIEKYIPFTEVNSNEIFPNYPDQPYRSLKPNATPDEIFRTRVEPWLLNPVKVITQKCFNLSLVVYLQTSPFSGLA